MNKRVLLVALAGINLLLLAALILLIHKPSEAVAQMAAEGVPVDGYLVISGKGEMDNDIVYVIDAQNEFLHAFRTPFPMRLGMPINLRHLDSRDLTREFRREAPTP